MRYACYTGSYYVQALIRHDGYQTNLHPKGLVLLKVMSMGKFHTKFRCDPLLLLVV